MSVTHVKKNSSKRKYIPVDTSISEKKCQKAYVNVYAISPGDGDYAIICCDDEIVQNASPYFAWISDSYEDALCARKPTEMPFAGKLTTIVGSWVLPTLVILVKVVILCFQNILHREFSDGEYGRALFRRLIFYFLVMNVRGWILFLLFNIFQNALIPEKHMSGSCWYNEYIIREADQYSNCYGKNFDFSDHVVLFLGQIIPLVSCEFFITLLSPEKTNNSVVRDTAASQRFINFTRMKFMIPIVNTCFFVYMNIIVFLALYKTAAYFHTPSELAVGYMISLLVQLTCGLLIFGDDWATARKYAGILTIVDFTGHND